MTQSERLRSCAKHTGLDALAELLIDAADEIDALQARAQVQGEPVYWEWRHLGNNQFAADFGQWSEWKRVEARNPIFTAEDELRTLRRYIADGYKYELRAILAQRPQAVPMTDEQAIEMNDAAFDKYMTQDARAIELVRSVEAHHGITAAPTASDA